MVREQQGCWKARQINTGLRERRHYVPDGAASAEQKEFMHLENLYGKSCSLWYLSHMLWQYERGRGGIYKCHTCFSTGTSNVYLCKCRSKILTDLRKTFLPCHAHVIWSIWGSCQEMSLEPAARVPRCVLDFVSLEVNQRALDCRHLLYLGSKS